MHFRVLRWVISHFADILSLLLIQEGAQLFDEEEKKTRFGQNAGVSSGTGRPLYPFKEAIDLYTSYALPSSQHASWNLKITGLYPEQKEIGAFARGKVAMIFGFSTTYNEIKIAIDGLARSNESTISLENVGISPTPQFSGSGEIGKNDAFAKYFPLVVSRNSAYPEEAWELLNFLASPESLAEYHKKTNKPTSRLDMVEEQSTEAIFGVFARQAAYSKSLRTIVPEDFFELVAVVVEEIIKNRISLDEGVTTLGRQMDCVLEKREKPELEKNCFSL
jgi:ABC-type glycerol-3-phosphate transport system substrate-binding protein